MTKPKKLTRRQLALQERLFDSDAAEPDVLKECNIEPKLFNRWLTEPAFIEQFDKCMAAAHRRSTLHLARSAQKAASKLVALSEKGEGETTRKACLDIISGCDLSSPADRKRETIDDGRETRDVLTPDLANRILDALAEEPGNKQCSSETRPQDSSKAEIRKHGLEPIPSQIAR